MDVHFRVLAEGYPHDEQVCFWMWRERRPEYQTPSAMALDDRDPAGGLTCTAPLLPPQHIAFVRHVRDW